MKTIEEKAKAYDEAFERAKECHIDGLSLHQPAKDVIEHIFPELKESEEERIKKVLIDYFNQYKEQDTCGAETFNGIPTNSIIAWLEKQSQKETTWNKEDEENMNNVLYILNQLKDTSSYEEDNIAEKTINWFKSFKDRLCSINEYDKDMLGAIEYCVNNNRSLEKEHIAWLKKQGRLMKDLQISNSRIAELVEEKHNLEEKLKKQGEKPQGKTTLEAIKEEKADNVNKVGPKFKVGDFIANDYCRGRVIEITDDAYLLGTEQGIPFSCEHNAHPWTIQDAKDGDVLINGSNIFIFHFINDTRLMGYCHVNTDDRRFYDDIGKNECFCLIDAVVKPATKEQRELLFEKMHEAGYEWDEEKKELKKIEDEEYNGEDYGIDSLYHAQRILEKTLGSVDGYQTDDGILSHKCAITAVKKLYEQKPAWSEEDETGFTNTIIMLKEGASLHFIKKDIAEAVDWLESIKAKIGG